MKLTIEDKELEMRVEIEARLSEDTLDALLLGLVVPALAALGYAEESIHEALNVPW